MWIAPTIGEDSIEDFAVRSFEAWRVGRKGIDDGLVLFVFPQDRLLRIEVGYGLEERVPDAIASRIIREVITPRLQAGEPDGAIRDGVVAIVAAIEGRAWAPPGTSRAPTRRSVERREVTLGQMVLFGVLGVGFLFLLATNPTLAIYLLLSVLGGGGRGGGFGGGGGGFSGGGGRSGGGGATGSW